MRLKAAARCIIPLAMHCTPHRAEMEERKNVPPPLSRPFHEPVDPTGLVGDEFA